MWNAQSLAPVQTIQNDPGQRRGSVSLAGGRDVRGFAFDRTGDLFASASWDNTIKLWRRSGALVHTFERQAKPVNAVAFSPTMPRLVSGGSDGLVRIWDTTTFQPVASFQHKRSVRDVQFSPDGRNVLVSDTSRTATVWDVATNRSTVLDGHGSTIWTASYDSSGTGVVTASKDGTARVWNTRDPRGAIALRGHTGSVNEAIFTPDGARIVTVGDDGSWRSWDRKTGQSVAVVGGFAGIQLTSIAVSPNGTQVLGIDVAGAPRILDVGTRSVVSGAIGTLPDGNSFVRGIWRPDGRQIALLTGEGQIFLVSPGAGGANAPVRLERPTAAIATDVAYSSNSERLAVADKTGEIGLWNVREGPTFVATMLGARSNVQSLAVSSNGAFVAAATTDSRLRVWNTRTGVPLLSQPVDVNTQAMRFDPDDALVTAWDDGTVRRYLVAPLLEPSTAAVVSEGLRRFGTPMSWAAAQEVRGDALGALTGDVRRAIESALSDREAPRTPPAQ
jgi:WD40 repeat protein